jgi:antitoxin MazE
MQTRVQRWGNSLAIRIPKAFANEFHLEHNSPVDISMLKGKIVVEPVIETELTLEQLVANITEHNLHGEIDTGASKGNEAW